jgi:hypothetical protein
MDGQEQGSWAAAPNHLTHPGRDSVAVCRVGVPVPVQPVHSWYSSQEPVRVWHYIRDTAHRGQYECDITFVIQLTGASTSVTVHSWYSSQEPVRVTLHSWYSSQEPVRVWHYIRDTAHRSQYEWHYIRDTAHRSQYEWHYIRDTAHRSQYEWHYIPL